jgi:MFS family permease
VAALMVAYIFSFVDRSILALLVGPIRRDLGISDTQISLLHGFAFAIFYTFLGIVIARAADRGNRRNIIVGGIAIWSIMTAACGLARNFLQLFFGRIGVGVGEAALSPAAYSMIADSFPKQRLSRALSVYTIGLPMGAGLALVIGGVVVQIVTGTSEYQVPMVGAMKAWQVTFLIVGLPGLLVAAWLLTLPEPVRRHAAGAATFRETLRFMRSRGRAYACHIFGFAIFGLAMNSMTAWGPTFFVRVFGLPVREAGLAVGGAFTLAGTAGILAGGWLADELRWRGHTDATLRAGLVAAIALVPCGMLVAQMPSPVAATALMFPTAFLMTFPFGAAAAGIQALTPGPMRAQASAIYLFFVNLIGIGIGPTATALLTDRLFGADTAVGYSLSLMCGLAPAVAALLLWRGLAHFRAAVG